MLDALLHVSQMISVCLSGWILDRMGYEVAESQKDVYFQTTTVKFLDKLILLLKNVL